MTTGAAKTRRERGKALDKINFRTCIVTTCNLCGNETGSEEMSNSLHLPIRENSLAHSMAGLFGSERVGEYVASRYSCSTSRLYGRHPLAVFF